MKKRVTLLRALAIREKTIGGEHPDTAMSLFRLAELFYRQGMFQKAEPHMRRALTIQTTIIQREASMMARRDRQSFVDLFGHFNQIVFSTAERDDSGPELALFSRLNRQGLLEEIEKRQAQLAALPGEQQEVALRLRELTQQLSSLALSSEERDALKEKHEQLERRLHQLLPELKPRVVLVSDVATALPDSGALIEFQRYALRR